MLETLPGQAHFAVADAKRTCRECEHWANQSGKRSGDGLLKEARCRKARMPGVLLPPIPHSAKECRHFTAASNPPAVRGVSAHPRRIPIAPLAGAGPQESPGT